MKPNGLTRLVSLLILASTALTAQVTRQANVVPLKNWATPLYWQPNQSERQTAATAHPEFQLSPTAVSNTTLTFVAVTPCRLVDTRGASAGFNGIAPFSGPAISAMGTLTIPVQSATEASTNTTPAPCGVIPSIAQAYSFNLTVVPQGAFGFLSIWPSGTTQPVVSTLNDLTGQIESNAVIVPAGTPSGGVSVYNSGGATTDVILDMNGFFAAPTDLNGNTAVGSATMTSNTTGMNNTAMGTSALQVNTTGSANTADGSYALQHNTTGNSNTANGGAALYQNTTGSNNTASGTGALYNNTTGGGNTAAGTLALESNTTGNNNTATGYLALITNTTGSNNTASGQNAMDANTTGCCNTASGQNAMAANTTGSFNVGIGGSALQANTTGSNNTVAGQNAMANNTTGCCNVAVGQAALQANNGNANVAVGGSALQDNTSGTNNTAVGQAALLNNTTGVNNVAVGQNALNAITTSNGDTAVGAGAMSAFIGTQNTAVGTGALAASGGGVAIVAVGWGALGAATGGNNNIAIGNLAAHNVTGNANNIHIGSQGNSADNNTIKIGTQGTQTNTYIAGIYGATPSTPNLLVCIDANGNLGTTGCSTPSSARFKEQITDMGDRSSRLLQLRPVTFFYKPQYDDGSHALQYGLIAEEVAKLYPDMVGYDKDGQPASVKYQSLAPMLLNEVQKENAQIRSLEERLAALEALLSGQTQTAARTGGSQ